MDNERIILMMIIEIYFSIEEEEKFLRTSFAFVN